MSKRALIPLAAVVLVVGGIVAVAHAATTTATCTASPAVVNADGGTSQKITVVCKVPNPPASTVTATVTATATATVTVSPSGSPSATVSPSSTPTVTPTPTPTPTQTPTPTVTPTPTEPPTTGFPDASSTGWRHTGVTLRTVKVGDTGPGWSAETVGGSPVFYVRGAGAAIDGLDIPMCVKILADNVTITRSRIACASYYTVNVSDPPTYYKGLTLTDVELDGLGDLSNPGIAVMAGSGGATYTRLDVHGFGSSGPRMSTGSTLQDSYIHGFVCASDWHSAGSSANSGGTNIRWLHNNIDVRPTTGPNTCASNALSIYLDGGTNYDGVQMIGNKIAGGAYGVYTLQNQGAKNVRVENNVFVRGSFVYGPAAQLASGNGSTFLGNTWDDGAPLN